MEPDLPLPKQLSALRAPCLGTLDSVPKVLLLLAHPTASSEVRLSVTSSVLKDALSSSSESLLCKEGQSAVLQDTVLYSCDTSSVTMDRFLTLEECRMELMIIPALQRL